MTRPKTFVILILTCLSAIVGSGCRPSAANTALRKEKHQLQGQIHALETQRAGDLARIKALESQEARPALVPQDKLDILYTAHGLNFGRLTGGYREPAGAAHDTGVVVHVVPTDQDGQTLKAAGSFVITAFDLGIPDKPLVAKREFALAQSRANWNGRAMLFNYVLKVPFQTKPLNPDLLIRVEFIDALTGRALTAEKKVTVTP